MAGKDFTLLTLITFGAVLTNQIVLGGLIRPPAVPPYASTLSVYLSPPPPTLLPAPRIFPPALPLPLAPTPHLFNPTLPTSPFNPLFLPPLLPPSSVLSGLPVLPNAPLLPPPFAANGLRFFSTKGVFPLLPAYPPVFPAPAPILPPASFPPSLLPAYPAPAFPAPAFPAPALPSFPPPALPAFPGFPSVFSAGPSSVPFAPIRHLYRRDTNTPK